MYKILILCNKKFILCVKDVFDQRVFYKFDLGLFGSLYYNIVLIIY